MTETVSFKPPVRERAEAQSAEMTEEQAKCVRQVANELHRLNQAVIQLVESGVSVEILRTSRHHADGAWGDMVVPVVVRR
ncbi:hypothetical protein JSE7799_02150 [Jannaschia seosinensis]|uniref:Uncharacterized protein n=1 Tax=Jannaschia seosinensis TaxID=313367 RepID=A0A0M7BC77_9RHOB|nr:hypothetical protein [Jannaschia seosinensis]CUH39424.1 hypothetical protein JSE7799_02150 [Jannaschia seosinensis]